MSWLRIDDSFPDHPKILALKTDTRRFTWIQVLAYTCRYRRPDVPVEISKTIPKANKKFIEDCIALGLVDVETDGRNVVHDWDEYQAGNPAKAARQARWRANVDARVDANVDAYVDGRVDASVDASHAPARAFPSRPVPVEENLLPVPPANSATAGGQDGKNQGEGQEHEEHEPSTFALPAKSSFVPPPKSRADAPVESELPAAASSFVPVERDAGLGTLRPLRADVLELAASIDRERLKRKAKP